MSDLSSGVDICERGQQVKPQAFPALIGKLLGLIIIWASSWLPRLKGMLTIRGRAIQQAVECRPNWRSLVPAKIRFARDALVNKDAGHHPLA